MVCANFMQAQKIKKNEVDKFNGNQIVETSNEAIYKRNGTGNPTHRVWFVLRRTIGDQDTIYSLVSNILLPSIEKYTEDSYIQLLLEDGSSIKSKTLYTGIGSERWGDGYCFSTTYFISKDDAKKLRVQKITDIRVKTLGASWDFSIKKKKQELLMKLFGLVDGAK